MSGLFRLKHKKLSVVTLAFATCVLASCQMAENMSRYDRSADVERQAFREALMPVPAPVATSVPVPDFQPMLSTPADLRLPSPLVTVSVNQTVSLRDLLFELAEQGGIDLEMDPQIHGSIIFTAKERPFDEVIQRISKMAGLRYSFENHVLRIELDRPYVKSYTVDYLNIERKGSSKIETDVSLNADGTGASSSSSSGSGGSESKIESKTAPDLWAELEINLEQILTSSDTYIPLATLADPVSRPTNPYPAPPPAIDPNNPNVVPPPPAPGSPQVTAMAPAAAPVINITPKSEPLVPNPPSTFSISRQTGLVTIFASERQQKIIKNFLNNFRKFATTQVLIEAKVLEVALTDEFSTGIDWGTFNLTGLATMGMTFPSPGLNPADAANAFTGILRTGSDLNLAAEAINRFGTVRALSSPRITVVNNQPAVVNVAKNIVFFNITPTITPPTDTAAAVIAFDTTPIAVPEGMLLNVVPRANPDTGEIFLALRPTITKINDFVTDPTVTLTFAAAQLAQPAGIEDNQVPQVSIQEMDSFIRLQSGQIMVMGGLMKDINTVQETGAPILSEVPLLGRLFKSTQDKVEKSELVIFLRATIIPGSNVDDTDREMYHKFGFDRHPAAL